MRIPSIVAVTVAAAVSLSTLTACSSQKRIASLETRVKELEAERAQRQEIAARLVALEQALAATGGLAEQISRLSETVQDARDASERARDAAEDAAAAARRAPAAPAAPTRAQPDPTIAYAVPIHDSPILGPRDALVTIVVAGEFACPFCEKLRTTLADLRARYPDDVRIVHKHYIVHPQVATEAAHGACAAHHQGRYEAMAEALWTQAYSTRQFDATHIVDLARGLGLDMTQFTADMNGKACEAEVQRDVAALTAVGVRGTPASFINGRYLSGAQPLASFQALIDEELKKAKAAVKGGIKKKKYYEHVVKTGKASI